MKPGRLHPVILAAAFAATGAFAQDELCPIRDLAVQGRLLDADGTPVADAQVTVTWEEEKAGELSVTRPSNEDGSYEVPLAYSTFSGRTFTGNLVCEFVLESVQVSVAKSGYREAQQRVAVDALDEPVSLQIARR